MAKQRKPAVKPTTNGIGHDKAKSIKQRTKKKVVVNDGAAKDASPPNPRIKEADEKLLEVDGVFNDPPSGISNPKEMDNKNKVAHDLVIGKPAKKKKAKQAAEESQTKLPRRNVTKSSSLSKRGKIEAASTAVDASDSLLETDTYGLIEAVKRRSTWTPPPLANRTSAVTIPLSFNLADDDMPSRARNASVDRSTGFADLLGSFGFTRPDNDPQGKAPNGEGTRKRKLIELVKTNYSTAAATAPKTKAPKKTARTITGQATSVYAEEEVLEKTAPLLQYFSLQTNDIVEGEVFKIPPKPRSKSPIKVRVKPKKGSAEAPILLSPGSALKQVGNQDFVFGTSSQLAREDSPTLLRDLHEAMQASNELCRDSLADSIPEPEPLSNQGRSNLLTNRNLWSAASRDAGGELMEVDIVDLTGSSSRLQQPNMQGNDTSTRLAIYKDDEVHHDVDRLTKSSLMDEMPKIGPLEAAIRSELLSSPMSRNTISGSSLKASDVSQAELSPKAKKSPVKNVFDPAEMPDFSSFTTAHLAKQIASYRFKPIKSRDQMILLLEKCWEGKHRSALTALDTNHKSVACTESFNSNLPSAIETASPTKRPRGRPRKESISLSPPKLKFKKSKVTPNVEHLEPDIDASLSKPGTPKKSRKKGKEQVEDISSLAAPLTPSPPRRQASQPGTALLPLELSASADIDSSPQLSPTSSQKLLFSYISRAVTAAPPAKDSSNPSWHEKLLLYDPIILEDLTIWLNTGALEQAGWDGEVEPKEVKRWCESKSICCLWKENLRGGARSRY